jgi:hypothetical protein
MAAILMPSTIGSGTSVNDADQHVWRPDTGPRISAALLARLAEAADGHRTGAEIWFVGQLKPDFFKAGHKIRGPYASKEIAFASDPSLFAANPANDTHKIFGPFLTTSEVTGTKVNQIKRVILVLQDDREICLDGAKYDCVFWSLSAYDKFVVPYYVQVGTLDEAEEVRDKFRLDTSTVAGTHIPGSEIIGATTMLDGCPQKAQPKDEDTLGLSLIKVLPSVEESPILLPI